MGTGAVPEAVQKQLEQVQSEIDKAVEDLISSVETVAIDNEVGGEESPESKQQTLDELWVIKSAVQELESLEALGELDTAFTSLQEYLGRVQTFAADHPSALLTADLERRASDMGRQLRQRLQENWLERVSVKTTKTAFEIRLVVDDELVQTAARHMPSLIEEFLLALAPVFDAVINLEVREVFEDETSVELGRTAEPLDVVTLIDVVQTLVLAFGGVLVGAPDLQARIARRYGHYIIDSIVYKSLPALFPENAEELGNFKKDVEGLRGLEDVMSTEGWMKGHELSSFANSFDSQWIMSRENHYLTRLRDALAGEYKKDDWDWDGEDFGDDDFDEEPSEPKEKAMDILQAYSWELESSLDPLLAVYRALAPGFYRSHPMVLYVETMALVAEVSSLDASAKSIETTEFFARHVLAEILADNSSKLDRALYAIMVNGRYDPEAIAAVMNQVDGIAQTASEAGPQIQERVVSQAVEQIVTYLIRSVEGIVDISETESINIATNLSAFRGCSAYFTNISVSVPSWVKLQRLEAIVQGRLHDIADMAASGMLSDFSADELESLITALFIDSEHRQQVLDLVYRTCG